MTYIINNVYDLGRRDGWEDGWRNGWRNSWRNSWEDGRKIGLKEGEIKGDRNRLRKMLKICITLRFPQTSQTTISNILSIPDDNVLESIFKVACTADSFDNFQRDVRGMAPVN